MQTKSSVAIPTVLTSSPLALAISAMINATTFLTHFLPHFQDRSCPQAGLIKDLDRRFLVLHLLHLPLDGPHLELFSRWLTVPSQLLVPLILSLLKFLAPSSSWSGVVDSFYIVVRRPSLSLSLSLCLQRDRQREKGETFSPSTFYTILISPPCETNYICWGCSWSKDFI